MNQIVEHWDRGEAEKRERQLESLRRALGPKILAAFNTPTIHEVLCNADGRIWFDEFGKGMYDTGIKLSPIEAEKVIIQTATMLGTVATAETPIVEGELPLNDYRFEGLIPPVVSAPVFAIRKPTEKVLSLADLEAQGVLTHKDDPLNQRRNTQANFARLCAGQTHRQVIELALKMRQNIITLGGTGTGKTTVVNGIFEAAARLVPDDRWVIIEDTRESRCLVENKVMLRTSQTINMHNLLRATLRLRPDRIAVSEVRGGEFVALIKMWRTGHPGGLASLHADSPEEATTRMEQMVEEAGLAPNRHVIANVANVLVFIEREAEVKAAGRKIREVVLVAGYDEREKRYLFQKV